MTLFNNLIDNNYVIYGLFTITAGLTTYLVIKSYLYPSIIETPPTFNFTQRELSDIQEFMNQGGVLNQETNDRLDQDLQTIMGEDLYNEFQHDIQLIDNEFT